MAVQKRVWKALVLLNTYMAFLAAPSLGNAASIRTGVTYPSYWHLGCFADSSPRALPNYYRNGGRTVGSCFQKALELEHKMFGVQNGGECWLDDSRANAYNKYGKSNACKNGTGGKWANSVYEIKYGISLRSYPVKRCYKVDFRIFYKIPGGVQMSEDDAKTKITPLLNTVKILLPTTRACRDVKIAMDRVLLSPPGVDNVLLGATVVFTMKESVPLQGIDKTLTNCIERVRGYAMMLGLASPAIDANKKTYTRYNSIVSKERSCCGSIPPPCCTVGSVRSISADKCVCVPGYFLRNGSLMGCSPCPKDTYQKNKGSTSCTPCPQGTSTFGNVAAANQNECSGIALLCSA